MVLTSLPAMKTSPKYVFFTDFDGTITLADSNDFLTDNYGIGITQRKQLNKDVLVDGVPFRDTFQAMLDSVQVPFEECIQILLENIKLDPHFKEFLRWARDNNIPVVVLSGGMRPIIEALLVRLVGQDAVTGDQAIQIVSNDVMARDGKDINEKGGWKVIFHDESGFGHDKSLEIRPYAALPDGVRPSMFYAGDGVSDLSAAKETDLLFAKKGRDLVTYCVKERVPFTEFEDFSDILSRFKDIVAGNTTVKEVSKKGLELFEAQAKQA